MLSVSCPVHILDVVELLRTEAHYWFGMSAFSLLLLGSIKVVERHTEEFVLKLSNYRVCQKYVETATSPPQKKVPVCLCMISQTVNSDMPKPRGIPFSEVSLAVREVLDMK